MADSEEQKKDNLPQHTKIVGRFDQYRSSYWAAAIAMLSVRYLAKPFGRPHWDNPQASFLKRHSYAAFGGGIMEGAVAFYAWKTWKDIRSIYAESLAWEFNKDPKDVSFKDFLHSKNTIVRDTISKYTQYNLRRALVNSVFFVPFIFKPLAKKHNMHGEVGIDLGMAANGVYLFSDIMGRKITPFEALQSLIDRKVNHVASVSDEITAGDLMNVYEYHAEKSLTGSFTGQKGTPRWEKSMELFERMADLMNQTYNNKVATEPANFTFPKLIYLIGHGLIDPDRFDRTRSYIELANRYGMEEVKRVEQAISGGASAGEAIFDQYALFTPKIPEQNASTPVIQSGENTTTELPASAFGLQQTLKKDKTNLSMAGREADRQSQSDASDVGLAL